MLHTMSLNRRPFSSFRHMSRRMAGVRAGVVGMSRSPRFTVFSSRGNEWSPRHETLLKPERRGKGYGISVTSAETARTRWKHRKKMMDFKLKLCDWTVVFALSGLILAMLDVEVCASGLPKKYLMFSGMSDVLRVLTMLLTVVLLIILIVYHVTDLKIYLIETGSDNWRLGLTKERAFKMILEMVICGICPIPDTGTVSWPLLSSNPEKTRTRVVLPWNVLLCLPMFLRLYILCRYIVLHSSQYQDCATRTIASLNHIAVDFRFVVRSQLYARPLYLLSIATLCFWIVVSWMLTQCERFTHPNIPTYQHFLDYLWFEIITFFSIGYGDIQVQTYCGRALAMLTAIVGTLFSSTLIALVGRRMALSSSEKRVNHLIAENQYSRDHKHAAARVLQNTWRTVLRQREYERYKDAKNSIRLTTAQRGLLRSVLAFRKTRWRLRMQAEDEDDYFTAKRAFMETEERLEKVRNRQSQLDGRLGKLMEHVETLTNIVANKSLFASTSTIQ